MPAERAYVRNMAPALMTAEELLHIYRHDGTEQMVTADQALDGETVLPGFSCHLRSIL